MVAPSGWTGRGQMTTQRMSRCLRASHNVVALSKRGMQPVSGATPLSAGRRLALCSIHGHCTR